METENVEAREAQATMDTLPDKEALDKYWTHFRKKSAELQLSELAGLIFLYKKYNVISSSTPVGKDFLTLLPLLLDMIAFRLSGRNPRDILPNPPKPKRRVNQQAKE